MRDSNNLPKAISHKKLSSLLINAHKDKYSMDEDDVLKIEQQEFTELLENWEENTKNILNKLSSKNKKNILENKSSGSIMAIGAMEVHLNMALQALKVFTNDNKQ